jgi:hypothetical protein
MKGGVLASGVNVALEEFETALGGQSNAFGSKETNGAIGETLSRARLMAVAQPREADRELDGADEEGHEDRGLRQLALVSELPDRREQRRHRGHAAEQPVPAAALACHAACVASGAPRGAPLNVCVRPLWSATLMPQLSSMEFGRVEYVDRVANAIVKGNVYGTL